MSSRADLWLSSGLGVLLASAGALLVWPEWRARSAARAEIAALSAELSKPSDGPEVMERMAKDLERLRSFGAGRMTPIPVESDVAGMVGSIGAVLDGAGLSKRDITTRSPRAQEDVSSLPVTVMATGSFPSVFQAVCGIEGLDRLVRVERFSARAEESGADPGSWSGSVRSEMSIEAFFGGAASVGGEERKASWGGEGR